MSPNFDLARELLKNSRYPRTAKYDPEWLIGLDMGCPTFWLLESLCEVMDLQPGMRVMDLGCGKAAGSIFLAKEYGLQVWAVDPAVKPTENWERIREFGLEDQVFPLNADGNRLPFAQGSSMRSSPSIRCGISPRQTCTCAIASSTSSSPAGNSASSCRDSTRISRAIYRSPFPSISSLTGPLVRWAPGILPNGGGVTGTRPSKWTSSLQITSLTMKAIKRTCVGSRSSSIPKNSPRMMAGAKSHLSAW